MANGKYRPWIDGLDVYKPGKSIEGKIKLASNENNYGPSPQAIEAVIESAPLIYKYPYQDRQVLAAISEYVKLDPGNIVVGNGSDELIDFIIKVFKGPYAGSYPSYSEYPLMSGILGERYIQSRVDPGFTFDAERFIEETADANVLILCSPNNPTGKSLTREQAIKVLDTGKTVVVDQAYIEFGGENLIGLVSEYDNLIVLRTFAKAFGLAGLRAGYIIASEPVINAFGKVKPPFNVSLPAQRAIIAALEDLDYTVKCVKNIMKDRQKLYNALDCRFNAVSSDANFILADTSPEEAQKIYDEMLAKGFITRMFGRFEGFDGQYLRVTVGTSRENQEFIDALGE